MLDRTPVSARILAGCLALAPILPGRAAAQTDPYAVMEAAEARFDAIGTLCADFEQSLTVALLNQTRDGAGRMCQRGTNLFSMRFTRPEGDLVVVDGSDVWVYYPSQDPGQVIRAPVRNLGLGIDFQREFLEDPRGKYTAELEGQETVAGVPAHRIRLVPRGSAPYRDATVWIGRDDPLLRKVEVHEENGSVRIVTLSSIQVDPAVDGDVFTFTPPPGVRVVTR